MRKYLLNPKFVWMLALWTAVISAPPSNAFAFPSESISTVQSVSPREAQINKVMDVLSRPEARAHLLLMRIDVKQVETELTKLDDAQLAQVAQKADAVKAAGDGGLGLVIALLVIVLLVVLILSFSNKKVIVKDAK